MKTQRRIRPVFFSVGLIAFLALCAIGFGIGAFLFFALSPYSPLGLDAFPTPPADTSLLGFTPTAAPLSTPISAAFSCIPRNPEQMARVNQVVDGDTIRVSLDGREFTVRYIGVDTPESTTKVEPFGVEAARRNAELVGGKAVILVKDVSETDRYGRLLRYVLVDGLFVNLKLVQEGYAQAVTYPPDVACAETFLQAEREARKARLGLWGLTAPSEPTYTPRPGAAPGGQNCHPAYPDVCIPPPPPDLSCSDIPYRNFRVLPPDPHKFDINGDGIGCEKR